MSVCIHLTWNIPCHVVTLFFFCWASKEQLSGCSVMRCLMQKCHALAVLFWHSLSTQPGCQNQNSVEGSTGNKQTHFNFTEFRPTAPLKIVPADVSSNWREGQGDSGLATWPGSDVI